VQLERGAKLLLEKETLTRKELPPLQGRSFCTVSQSVRTGIPFTVTVKSRDGRVLK
jgi:hypothetical protein